MKKVIVYRCRKYLGYGLVVNIASEIKPRIALSALDCYLNKQIDYYTFRAFIDGLYKGDK